MKDDDTPQDNILLFPTQPTEYTFTDGVEEYNVDEYVDILVEDLEAIQWEMQAILDSPEGLSDISRLSRLVAELTNVIDGYSEEDV